MKPMTEKPVDMKLTKEDMKGTMMGATVAPEKGGPKYPWGLELRLDKTSLDKLGIAKELPEVGELCQIVGVGRVTSVSERENQSGNDCDVTIQIERLNLHHEDEDAAFAKGARRGRGRASY